jgi:hypothetical protein
LLLTIQKLNELRNILQEHKQNPDTWCEKPLLIDGKETRRVEKPKATKPNGHKYPDGTVLKHLGSLKFIDVPNGVHGKDYLAIDTETLGIVCTKCKEEAALAAKGAKS